MESLRSSRIGAWLIVLTLVAAGVLLIQTVGDRADAQQQAPGTARAEASKVLIDPADTVILLLDHQSGLFQTVKDISVVELRTNTENDTRPSYAGRGHTGQYKCGVLRAATHMESGGRCGVWRPVCCLRSELQCRDRELPESAGSPQAGEEVNL